MRTLSGMILLMFTMVGGPVAMAADGSSSVTAESPTEKKASKFGMATSFVYASNLYAEGEFENAKALSLDATPSYKVSPTLTASARIILSKNLVGPGDSNLNNIRLRLSKKAFSISKNLKMSPRISGYAPSDETARKNTKYQGGLAAGLVFVTKNPVLGMNLSFGSTLKKDFHQYETDNRNSDMVSHSASNFVESSIPLFGDKTTLSLSAVYQTAQSYRGNLKNAYILGQTITQEISDSLSVSIGHTNQANAFKYDGISSNIEVFNSNSSSIYFALNMSN